MLVGAWRAAAVDLVLCPGLGGLRSRHGHPEFGRVFPAPRQEPEEETGNFPAVIPLLMLPL